MYLEPISPSTRRYCIAAVVLFTLAVIWFVFPEKAVAYCHGILEPPPQYNCTLTYVPYVHVVPWDEVPSHCGDQDVWGCSNELGRWIVLPDRGGDDFIACLMAHEHAHLCGWPVAHPGGH